MTDIEHAKKYAEESISLAISMYNPKAEMIAETACLYGLTYNKEQIDILSKHILELQTDKGRLTDRVKELEAQIDKMKCCYNCKHSRTDYVHCITNKHEKWEIKEK